MGIFDRLKRNMNEPTKVGSESDTAKSGQQEAPMEAVLKNLYNQLAQQILAMIPGKWETVYYLGEVEKARNSWSSVFYFKDPDRGEFVDSNTIPKVYQVPNSVYMEQWLQLNKILLEVYDHFAARKQPLWEQMSFSFDKTGKFHVDFNYDVMHDKDGGQLGRELVWAHRTFGYEPEEGSSQRKLLNRYLNRA